MRHGPDAPVTNQHQGGPPRHPPRPPRPHGPPWADPQCRGLARQRPLFQGPSRPGPCSTPVMGGPAGSSWVSPAGSPGIPRLVPAGSAVRGSCLGAVRVPGPSRQGPCSTPSWAGRQFMGFACGQPRHRTARPGGVRSAGVCLGADRVPGPSRPGPCSTPVMGGPAGSSWVSPAGSPGIPRPVPAGSAVRGSCPGAGSCSAARPGLATHPRPVLGRPAPRGPCPRPGPYPTTPPRSGPSRAAGPQCPAPRELSAPTGRSRPGPAPPLVPGGAGRRQPTSAAGVAGAPSWSVWGGRGRSGGGGRALSGWPVRRWTRRSSGWVRSVVASAMNTRTV
ncbi:hypothetical protein SUDANB96_05151 [Streptomyces sp. enrichment culture]